MYEVHAYVYLSVCQHACFFYVLVSWLNWSLMTNWKYNLENIDIFMREITIFVIVVFIKTCRFVWFYRFRFQYFFDLANWIMKASISNFALEKKGCSTVLFDAILILIISLVCRNYFFKNLNLFTKIDKHWIYSNTLYFVF